MKNLRRGTPILGALLVAAAALPQPRAAERVVAVTFDDLPATAAGVVANDVTSLEELTCKLLGAVRKHGVPAVGFVNEEQLFAHGTEPPDVEARTRLLRMWLDADLELGNHTYSHRDLNTMPLEHFEADVLEGVAQSLAGRASVGAGCRALTSDRAISGCITRDIDLRFSHI